MSILLAFENLCGKSETGVVGDVTVHEPVSRVVSFEGDDDEAIGREEDDVASRRVDQFGFVVGEVEGLVFFLLEDGEVMAMKVDLNQRRKGIG